MNGKTKYSTTSTLQMEKPKLMNEMYGKILGQKQI